MLPCGRRARAESAALLDARQAAARGAGLCAGLLDAPASEGGGIGGGARTALVEVVMRQGAKREVRRLLKAAGCDTLRLCRVRVGPVVLRERAGECRRLERAEVARLYRAAFAPSDGPPPPPSAMLPTYDSERGDWVHPLVRLARLEAAEVEDSGPGD